MTLKLRKQEKGFTIIEVLIVLAIAGLIMLVVFLAVPALQRNSRNSRRRSDAAKVLALVNEYVANHNGTLPTGFGAGATQVNLAAENFALYGGAINWNASMPADPNSLNIAAANGCDTTGSALQAGTARQFAAAFRVEKSGGGAGDPQCIES